MLDTNTIQASQEQTKHSSQDTPQDSQDDETPEEVDPSDSDDRSETTTTTASPAEPDNVPDSPTVYYDDVADPEPAAGGDISYVSAPLPSYSSSLQEQSELYDDADPEPAGYYSEYVSHLSRSMLFLLILFPDHVSSRNVKS